MIWLIAACTGPVPVPTEPGTPVPTVLDTSHTGVSFDLEEPWVLMSGGWFMMGSAEPEANDNEKPRHQVQIETFAIMRHEVLHVDYVSCVDEGVCTPLPDNCYSGDNPLRPATCLTWYQASDFCEWYGGRLATESEWEFAASSRGQDVEYPWGDEEPDCTRVNAGDGMGTPNCGNGIWNVCEHPLGNTPLGLCEMAGNAYEWTQDWYRSDYSTHPTDGSPTQDGVSNFKVMRGGAIGSGAPVRVRERVFHPIDFYYGGMGTRCVMDL